MSQTGAHPVLVQDLPGSETREKLAIEASPDALKRFFEVSAGARTAARSLRSGAEVGVSFTDAAGAWRFYQHAGGPVFEASKPKDPDFEVRLSPGAVQAICSKPDADIGELGIAFFERIVARDPEKKIRVTLHSGLVKLTMRGWLGVLAHGGPKVVGWLAQRGLSGPGAVATALARLKK
jgi:hypothetical protein